MVFIWGKQKFLRAQKKGQTDHSLIGKGGFFIFSLLLPVPEMCFMLHLNKVSEEKKKNPNTLTSVHSTINTWGRRGDLHG